MLFLAGVIGGKTRRSAMETVKMSFGQNGGVFFSFLNVLQLVGWTAIMIYDGALAADGVLNTGRWVWCLVIGALIFPLTAGRLKVVPPISRRITPVTISSYSGSFPASDQSSNT